MTMNRLFYLATSLIISLTPLTVNAGEAEFRQLQTKVEADVLELRDAVEAAYAERCNLNWQQCNGANYHGCLSKFPNPSCPAAGDFQFADCSGGASCSSIETYDTSTIRFPPSTELHDSDQSIVTSTCFSQELDSYFIQKRNSDRNYWSSWGVENPWMHFSSNTGMFRIFPGRPDNNCFTYDPRIRPFYVAGSSGPKNILLILDISGSMEGSRLEYLKEAALRIVDTLTIGDRIALIQFAGFAEVVEIESRSLMRATSDTKELLKQRIQGITAGGGTDFLSAFEQAFDVFEEAIPQELFVDCNTAVLFLTDGENRASDDGTVLEYIKTRIADIEPQISHPIRLFTYSVSDVDDVHELPKNIACTTTSNGVWSKIVRPEDIVEGLSSYETLFALGLGEGNNRNFTAWVEPYEFFNAKIMGTTVSAPVFDRSVSPPLLVGVVGMDFPMSALDRALGVPLGSTATFDRVVRSSTAQCPNLNISSCQLESFRAIGPAGSEAQCSILCNETASSLSLEAEKCPDDSAFSSMDHYSVSSVLANTEMDGVSFGARACCDVNTTELTEQCYSGGNPALSPFSSGSKQPAVWITLGIAATLVVNFGQLM